MADQHNGCEEILLCFETIYFVLSPKSINFFWILCIPFQHQRKHAEFRLKSYWKFSQLYRAFWRYPVFY